MPFFFIFKFYGLNAIKLKSRNQAMKIVFPPKERHLLLTVTDTLNLLTDTHS